MESHFDGEVSDGKNILCSLLKFIYTFQGKEILLNIVFSHADIKKSVRSGEPEASKSEVGVSPGVEKPRESKACYKDWRPD